MQKYYIKAIQHQNEFPNEIWHFESQCNSQGSDLKAVELQCFPQVLCHGIITYSGILQLQNLSIFVQSCQDWEEIFDP